MLKGSFKEWGPISGIVLGFLTYKLPELLIAGVVPFLLPLLPKSENIRNFILYGLFEALTIGLMFLILQRYGHRFRDIGLDRFRIGYIFKAFVGFCSYFIITSLAVALISQLYQIPDQEQQIGFNNPNGIELILAFIALVCVVPIAEELLFRGFIFKGIRSKFSFGVTTVVVSMLFAVAHGQINVGIDVFCLSLVLCYLREKTNSLWPGILLHSFKNAIAFLLLFIYNV